MQRVKAPVLVIEVSGNCMVIPRENHTVWRIFRRLCKSKGFHAGKQKKGKADKYALLQNGVYICVEEKTAYIPK